MPRPESPEEECDLVDWHGCVHAAGRTHALRQRTAPDHTIRSLQHPAPDLNGMVARIGVPPAGTKLGASLPGAAELGAAALGTDEGFGMGFALGGLADDDDAPAVSSISTSITSDELFLALASAELDMSTLTTVSHCGVS